MKKVVGLLVLLVFVQQLATAQKNEITWYSFEEAIQKTAEKPKMKFEFKGKEYTEQMMAYNMRVRSYPNFVVMDAAMENITQLPGYREPDNFISSLKILLENFDH